MKEVIVERKILEGITIFYEWNCPHCGQSAFVHNGMVASGKPVFDSLEQNGRSVSTKCFNECERIILRSLTPLELAARRYK